MAINKVVYGTDTLIDLTGDTVTADKLVTGATAHGKDGTPVTGTNPYEKATTDATVEEQSALIEQIITDLDGKGAGTGGGGSCDIIISDVNLADPAGIKPNVYIKPDGAEAAYGNWSITAYIPVEPEKYYSINQAIVMKELQYSAYYDENKQYLGQVAIAHFEASRLMLLHMPSDARFVRFSHISSYINNFGCYEVTGTGVV